MSSDPKTPSDVTNDKKEQLDDSTESKESLDETQVPVMSKDQLLDIVNNASLQNEQELSSSNEDLPKKKRMFSTEVQSRIDYIDIRINIIQFKYDGFKQWFDNFSILIIILSSLLTFMETIKLEFDLDTQTNVDEFVRYTFTMSAITISSIITIIAAILKFKKYQEQMEDMTRCIEKAIYIIGRLKRILEDTARVSDVKALDIVIQKFSSDTYEDYVKTQELMSRCINYEEVVEHMKTYYNLNVVAHREERRFQLDRMAIGLSYDFEKQAMREKGFDFRKKRDNILRQRCRRWFSKISAKSIEQSQNNEESENKQKIKKSKSDVIELGDVEVDEEELKTMCCIGF